MTRLTWDSFWLAHMRRLNILPEGYIYPKEERPVRDLLRRRLLFVRQRTSQILSLQSAIVRIGRLNKAVLIHKDRSQEKKEHFFQGEVFFLLTCPLMDDPFYKDFLS